MLLQKPRKQRGVDRKCYKYVSDNADDSADTSWLDNVAKGEEHFIKIYKDFMAKKRSIDFEKLLYFLDKRDKGWYNRLSAEQRKAFSTWMMMRYASSVQGKNAAHFIIYG